MPIVIISESPLVKVTLKRVSICPCGFRMIIDEINVGHVYEIDPNIEAETEIICGGCGKSLFVMGVYTAPGGFLPKILFEDDPTTSLSA